jgi:hypothetical protein
MGQTPQCSLALKKSPDPGDQTQRIKPTRKIKTMEEQVSEANKQNTATLTSLAN